MREVTGAWASPRTKEEAQEHCNTNGSCSSGIAEEQKGNNENKTLKSAKKKTNAASMAYRLPSGRRRGDIIDILWAAEGRRYQVGIKATVRKYQRSAVRSEEK